MEFLFKRAEVEQLIKNLRDNCSKIDVIIEQSEKKSNDLKWHIKEFVNDEEDLILQFDNLKSITNEINEDIEQIETLVGLVNELENAEVSIKAIFDSDKIKILEASGSSINEKLQEELISEATRKVIRNKCENISASNEYINQIIDYYDNASPEGKRKFERYIDDLELNLIDNSQKKPENKESSYYSPNTKEISLDLAADENNPRGNGVTFMHEFGHMIDDLSVSDNKEMIVMTSEYDDMIIRNEVDNYVKQYMKDNNIEDEESAYKAIISESAMGHQNSEMSDIFDGATKDKYNGSYGHPLNDDGSSYWSREGALSSEAFAHFYEMYMCDPEGLEEFKKILPKTYKEYMKLIK